MSSNCEKPTVLLAATKVDSPEDILSEEEENRILKNSMDLLNTKSKKFQKRIADTAMFTTEPRITVNNSEGAFLAIIL